MRSYKYNYRGVINSLIYSLQFNICSYDTIQICGWQRGSVRNVRGGLSLAVSIPAILTSVTSYS